MPNLFAAFTAEVYRILATQVVPGAIAISTWLIVLANWSADFRDFIEHHSPESSVCIALVSIFAGLVCEDFGSRIELNHYERCYRQEQPLRDQEWNDYLRTAFKTEPIGQQYLRTLVLRLKFEANTTLGLISAALGLMCLIDVSICLRLLMAGGMLGFAFYLGRFELSKTVCLLAETRRNLLNEIRIVG
jgi:hypothetical protein